MKNYRLKMKDLFKGRVVYLAEPNCDPVKVRVVGHVDSTVSFATIAMDTSGRSVQEILARHNGEYKLANMEMVADIAEKTGRINSITEGAVGLVKNYISPIRYVQVMAADGECHDIQDVYLNPAECKLKVFAKLKQAERYSDYPVTFGDGLETIFSIEE